MATNETVAEAKRRLRQAQRKCSWCGIRLPSPEDVIEHILDEHDIELDED